MKHLYLLLLLFFCSLSSCNEEDRTIDPTILPDATSEGKGTIGCVIDDWIYVGGRYGDPTATYGITPAGQDSMVITALVDNDIRFSFIIHSPREHATSLFTEAWLNTDSLGRGQVYISALRNGIVSGTFAGGRIKEGRFDLRYTEGEQE